MKPEWKDTTSYSKKEVERVPREYTLDFSTEGTRIKIILHHHMDCAPDTWLVTCRALGIEQMVIGVRPVEVAQASAIALCRKRTQKMYETLSQLGEV